MNVFLSSVQLLDLYTMKQCYVKILSITDLCKFGRYLNGRSFETVLAAAKRGI